VPDGRYLTQSEAITWLLDRGRLVPKDVDISDRIGIPPELVSEEKIAIPLAVSSNAQQITTSDPIRKDRSCLKRDTLWLQWYEEIGADTPNVIGQIRDKWNDISDSERSAYSPCNARIGKGKAGYDIVRKALKSVKVKGGK